MRGQLVGRGWTERSNLVTAAALNTGGALTTFSKEFPMGEGWRTMNIRFNLALVVGTGAGATAEGELLIIKNVQLRTDRGEIICNLPGRALYKIANYRSGEAPRKDAIAAASATYRVTLPIYFCDDFMLRPEDTILDTSRYNSVTLQLTYGTTADLMSAPGTATITATVDIEVSRSLGILPAAARPLFYPNYDYRPPVDAATTLNIDIERSADMSMKRMYVHSGTSGTAGIPWSGANADTIQNVIQIKDQNRFIEKDRIHAMIQDINKMTQTLESTISGVEVFDFVRDASITSSMSTGDKSVLQYTWTNQGGVGASSIVTLTEEMIRILK